MSMFIFSSIHKELTKKQINGTKRAISTTILLYVRIVTVWLLPLTHFLFGELLAQYKVGHKHDTSGLRLFHFLIYGAYMLPWLLNNTVKEIA